MLIRRRTLAKFPNKFRFLVGFVIFVFVYNEYLHYYLVLLQCRWPSLAPSDRQDQDTVRAMALADTHLLGSREGHWFDKLRREWQMEMAFQTSVSLNQPDVVFVLGDLFDEGKWCDNEEFQFHVERFRRKFRIPANTLLIVVAGNHDIGFHYAVDDNKRKRFDRAFNSSSVQLFQIKSSVFVLLTSMAFEGDGCSFCREAERSLQHVVQSLDCARGVLKNCSTGIIPYSRPILLQHFPLYRKSDSHCTGPDAAGDVEKKLRMRPRWSCLAEDISKKLLDQLKPRLVVSGHTHHFCVTTHRGNISEWTVPSFSWRNKKNPSFLLMAISDSSFAIEKCYLPDEHTVISIYIVSGIIVMICCCVRCCLCLFCRGGHHLD